MEVHVRGQCKHEEWIIRRETVYFDRNPSCSTVFSLCSSLSIAITWQIIYVSNPCCALSVSWFTLRTIFGGSIIWLCIVRVMVHPTNHIWRISNLCCALSVSWFTLQTIFGGSIIFVVYCPCHGSPYKPYLVS